MHVEYCCGVIPVSEDCSSLLMVRELSGNHWGFPKGHIIMGETSYEAATRELLEETSLTIKKAWKQTFCERFQYFSKYINGEVPKKVLFFIAIVEGNAKIQKGEIADCKWISISESENLATHPSTKNLCSQINLWMQRTKLYQS